MKNHPAMLIACLALLTVAPPASCASRPRAAEFTPAAMTGADGATAAGVRAAPAANTLVNPAGTTVGERFRPPEGFNRTPVEAGSFAEFLRNLPLKADGSPVRYHDGRVKPGDVHEAVVDIDVGDRDLQQCADAVMRLRAEYLYREKRYGEIRFNFANGFSCDYARWMDGYRVVVEGDRARWVKTAGRSDSYREFRKYLDVVFAYANTVSLAGQMKPAPVSGMLVGDVFVDRGHALIVVDMSEEASSGRKLFMIAQSYMPAQDIHVLKNPSDEGLSPWYDLGFGDSLRTPEWVFDPGDLRRFE